MSKNELIRNYVLLHYDPRKGYPGHWGQYYRCPLCGDIIPAAPPTSMSCGCGNVLVEKGSVRVKKPDLQPQLLKKRGPISKLLLKFRK